MLQQQDSLPLRRAVSIFHDLQLHRLPPPQPTVGLSYCHHLSAAVRSLNQQQNKPYRPDGGDES